MMRVSASSVFLLFMFLSTLYRGRCAHFASVLMPFAGLVRERLLYSVSEGTTHGLFLEMSSDGSVQGSLAQNSNCVLELRAVRTGHTVIKGVATSLFLCVNRQGHLRGQRLYDEQDCLFSELLLDLYTLFLSPHTGRPVSLSSKQFGHKHFHALSRFLPVMNKWFMVWRPEKEDAGDGGAVKLVDLDSDDPLGMALGLRRRTISSPAMHRRK